MKTPTTAIYARVSTDGQDLSSQLAQCRTGIYSIQNLANGRIYIGSASKDFNIRWATHRRCLRRRKHDNYKLQTDWCRYGEDAFVFSILETCAPDDCVSKEQQWIDRSLPHYNICPVAGSRRGLKHTPETILKFKKRPKVVWTDARRLAMSELFANRKFSAETRDKLRRRRLGKPVSLETREKMSRSHIGKKQTPEAIEKTRLAHLGSTRSVETREKMRAKALGHKRCLGRVVSDETRKKISAANKRRFNS
jgi:group I intron endonuclease